MHDGSVALKLTSGQVDPNDPNYDPDEDEPRRAPVALHAGHSEEMAAFKRAVRPQTPAASSRQNLLISHDPAFTLVAAPL